MTFGIPLLFLFFYNKGWKLHQPFHKDQPKWPIFLWLFARVNFYFPNFRRKKNKLSSLVNWWKFCTPCTSISLSFSTCARGTRVQLEKEALRHNWAAWKTVLSVSLWHGTEWLTRTFQKQFQPLFANGPWYKKPSDINELSLVHFFWLNGCVRGWCATVPFTHQCLHYVTWGKQDIIFNFLVGFTTHFSLPRQESSQECN